MTSAARTRLLLFQDQRLRMSHNNFATQGLKVSGLIPSTAQLQGWGGHSPISFKLHHPLLKKKKKCAQLRIMKKPGVGGTNEGPLRTFFSRSASQDIWLPRRFYCPSLPRAQLNSYQANSPNQLLGVMFFILKQVLLQLFAKIKGNLGAACVSIAHPAWTSVQIWLLPVQSFAFET